MKEATLVVDFLATEDGWESTFFPWLTLGGHGIGVYGGGGAIEGEDGVLGQLLHLGAFLPSEGRVQEEAEVLRDRCGYSTSGHGIGLERERERDFMHTFLYFTRSTLLFFL